jgi:hypothetical protein
MAHTDEPSRQARPYIACIDDASRQACPYIACIDDASRQARPYIARVVPSFWQGARCTTCIDAGCLRLHEKRCPPSAVVRLLGALRLKAQTKANWSELKAQLDEAS